MRNLENLRMYKQTIDNTATSSKLYPRDINSTDINFPNDELDILNKGVNYNLHFKRKNRVTTIALEAETAINQLSPSEKDPIRYQGTNNIQKLYTQLEKQRHHIRKIKYK